VKQGTRFPYENLTLALCLGLVEIIGPDESDRREYFVGTDLRLWMPWIMNGVRVVRKDRHSGETTLGHGETAAR
jgi:hypothetical protein